MDAKSWVDLVTGLAWPVCVLLLVSGFLVGFRPAIKALLGRAEEIQLPGGVKITLGEVQQIAAALKQAEQALSEVVEPSTIRRFRGADVSTVGGDGEEEEGDDDDSGSQAAVSPRRDTSEYFKVVDRLEDAEKRAKDAEARLENLENVRKNAESTLTTITANGEINTLADAILRAR